VFVRDCSWAHEAFHYHTACCEQEIVAELGGGSSCVAEQLQRESARSARKPEASFSVTQTL
jgi:hypothetical protein